MMSMMQTRSKRRTSQLATSEGGLPEDLATTPKSTSSSPYWTPVKAGQSSAVLLTPESASVVSQVRRKRYSEDVDRTPSKARRAAGFGDHAKNLPPTPDSLPRRKVSRTSKGKWKSSETDPTTTTSNVSAINPVDSHRIVATSETVIVEKLDKIWLIQERVRHDPWKMLVATSLLNVTSGRAARPIYVELLKRWPTPQALAEASIPDLTALLYPLGLFNQRASSLVRFSQQYLSLKWPIVRTTSEITTTVSFDPRPLPIQIPSNERKDPASIPDNLDVKIFVGAGLYASDSFRIYSDLLPGRGGPEKERLWLAKRERALGRMRAAKVRLKEEGDLVGGIEEVGDWLSDEESEDDGEDEWRKVRANDKELRRYLIWRWGLEGIVYDIKTGPMITRERDKRRLGLI